jgi:hypothetical protein
MSNAERDFVTEMFTSALAHAEAIINNRPLTRLYAEGCGPDAVHSRRFL